MLVGGRRQRAADGQLEARARARRWHLRCSSRRVGAVTATGLGTALEQGGTTTAASGAARRPHPGRRPDRARNQPTSRHRRHLSSGWRRRSAGCGRPHRCAPCARRPEAVPRNALVMLGAGLEQQTALTRRTTSPRLLRIPTQPNRHADPRKTTGVGHAPEWGRAPQLGLNYPGHRAHLPRSDQVALLGALNTGPLTRR